MCCKNELFMAALGSKFQDGLALHRQGKIAEAEHIYIEALRHDPQHSLALRLLGFITLQRDKIALRRLEDELASYDKAIARKPDDARGYVNRGRVLLKLLNGGLGSCFGSLTLDTFRAFLRSTNPSSAQLENLLSGAAAPIGEALRG